MSARVEKTPICTEVLDDSSKVPVKPIFSPGERDRSTSKAGRDMRSSGGGLMLAPIIATCWCWLVLCPELVLGRFVVETNSLTITAPESVKGSYDIAIGNFGVPQYGGTLSGIVVYADENSFACDPFSSATRFKPQRGSPPTIVLVDRGGCYFAQKAWRAQKAGAAAVLVADDRDEPLITMDSPEDDAAAQAYLDNITIPSALITRALGDLLRQTWKDSTSKSSSPAMAISAKLDWRESLPHPDDRVEYELWTSSNDACGPRCDYLKSFVSDFRGPAQLLEHGGFTLFSPHYITWYCPDAFVSTPQCLSQCINRGRYCSPDPEQDFNFGYDGKDVVLENLRQLCVHRIANQTLARPWLWWDYVTDFQIRCPMSEKRYNQECAESVIKSLGIDVQKVRSCMGDPTADEENLILSAEQEAQVGHGTRGDVTMLPTIIINNVQYRGKLDKGAVLKALCAGFEEKTEPAVCLTPDMETNECLTNNGGCWQDIKANITACKDTFRGRVCACPLVDGVQFQGDGYTSCVASGQGRCKINNGGCWQETKEGKTFSACSDSNSGCECPAGFRGNGTSKCEDIDECKEKTVCQCPECSCTNNWGSFDCECQGGLLYMREHDTCIGKKSGTSTAGWIIAVIVLVTLGAVIVALYVIYKYRLRSYMDSEIRAIMAQYMPLDSQNEVHSHLQDET